MTIDQALQECQKIDEELSEATKKAIKAIRKARMAIKKLYEGGENNDLHSNQ